VPRKPRLACPVKCEAYFTRVGGDESAQFKNNIITFPGCPALCAGSITAASPVAPLSCRYTYGKEDRTCFGKEEEKKHSKKRF